MSDKNNLKYAFWGTGPLAESCLYSLYKNNFLPEYIFTKPDAEVGRMKTLTAPMIKTWAESKQIIVIQPSRLKPTTEDLDTNNPDHKIDGYNLLKTILSDMDVCIVASYGMIIPEELLNLPKHGFINLHPSDLPNFRGPSPIESQLINNYKELPLSIMKLDAGMDSGDIIIKNKLNIEDYDTAQSLELKAGSAGGELISNILEDYINGNIKLQKQDNDKKTICKFIKKEDGEMKLSVEELVNPELISEEKLLEIKNAWRAYYGWPGIFFFLKHSDKIMRFKISSFNTKENSLEKCVERVIPEGKKEISFEDFRRGYL